jgi:ubiquinone/menaquinone biosynthesis C-methylase UbiE
MGLYGWYLERILPRCVDFGMRGEAFRELRPQCVGAAAGRVLELGFGSGLNLPHYGEGVDELVALDPARLGRELAAKRIADVGFPVSFAELDGARWEVEDESFDCVTCTWTLCTVASVAEVMAEVGRVLRPGGVFRFLEHGRSRDEGVAKWQRRLNGIQGVLFGGCQLDLHMDELISGAGIGVCEQGEFLGEGLRIYSSMYSGFVKKPE